MCSDGIIADYRVVLESGSRCPSPIFVPPVMMCTPHPMPITLGDKRSLRAILLYESTVCWGSCIFIICSALVSCRRTSAEVPGGTLLTRGCSIRRTKCRVRGYEGNRENYRRIKPPGEKTKIKDSCLTTPENYQKHEQRK